MFIAHTIAALIGNYMTTCFVIGLLVATVQVARHRGPRTGAVVSERYLDAFILWAVGIGQAINFVMHSFFGDFAAKTIGWAQSPFQLELAFSSLGFAVIAFVAHRHSAALSSKAAIVVAVAIGGLGAAGGHVFQLVVNHDHAVNNTGLLLYSDIVINVVGLAFVTWYAATRRTHDVPADLATASAPARRLTHV